MKLKIIILFIVTALAVKAEAQMAEQGRFLYFNNEEIQKIKQAIKSHDERIMPLVKDLKKQADKMMRKGPWAITSMQAPSASGDPHDYYSEGRYWWQNPNDPDGKYIRKDGLTNRDAFRAHTKMLGEVYNAVYYLSMAAYYLGDQKYADHAGKIISAWFLNPETKMNPNMNFAQAIKGVTPGRGAGIIDMHNYCMFPVAINLLKASGKWNDKDYNGLKDWFRQFLEWMQTSKNGIHEKNTGNNHSTWWAAQVIAYSIFLNDTSIYNKLIEHIKSDLIAKEIKPDGSCPKEEARTKSLHYTVFNQDAFSILCTMASLRGVDLWNYSTLESGSVKKAIDYALPYLQGNRKWEKENIVPFEGEQPISLVLAYIRFKNNDYLTQYENMGREDKVKVNDPFKLLINLSLGVQD